MLLTVRTIFFSLLLMTLPIRPVLAEHIGSRGIQGLQGQQGGQQRGAQGNQNQAQGAGGGGGGGGDVKYEKRTNPNEVKEFGKAAIQELKKADEKYSAAVDKLSQSFVQSLSALKAPPDDPALMKQLGEDLAKRKEISDKEPTIGGEIVNDIVKATKERSDLSVEQVKQTALQLQPPPPAAAPPAAPKVTVAERIQAFASQQGTGRSRLSAGGALAAAAAAGNDKAAIPSFGSRSVANLTPGPARGMSTPERMETGRGATGGDTGGGSSQGFAPNNFAVGSGISAASVAGSFAGASTIGSSTSSVLDANFGRPSGRASAGDDESVVRVGGSSRPRAIAASPSVGDLVDGGNVEISDDERNAKKNSSSAGILRRVRSARAARNSVFQQVQETLQTADAPKPKKSILVPSSIVQSAPTPE